MAVGKFDFEYHFTSRALIEEWRSSERAAFPRCRTFFAREREAHNEDRTRSHARKYREGNIVGLGNIDGGLVNFETCPHLA